MNDLKDRLKKYKMTLKDIYDIGDLRPAILDLRHAEGTPESTIKYVNMLVLCDQGILALAEKGAGAK